MNTKEPSIIFIDPIITQFKRNTPAIGYLGGCLRAEGFNYKVLNFNQLINSDQEGIFINKLTAFVNKHSNTEGDKSFITKLGHIQNLHYKFFSLSPAIVSKFINNTEVFNETFNKYFVSIERIKYFAVSISFHSQLLFSLVLINYIRNTCSHNIKIIVGGTSISNDKGELIKFFNHLPLIDYFVIGEGETALLSIIKQKKLSEIPNLIYRRDNQYIESKIQKYSENLEKLPPPYFSRSDIIYLSFSRQCYWNKCAFCTYKKFNCSRGSRRSANKVFRDLEVNLGHKKNKKFFCVLCDDCVTPAELNGLSDLILKNNINNCQFYSFMRCDAAFNRVIISKAKKAGFSTFNIGPETFQPRLLKIMNKGFTRQDIFSFIKNCNDIGIKLTIHVIVHIPTQRPEELMDELFDIKQLINKRNCIKEVFVRRLLIDYGSAFYNEPKKYAIKLLPARNTVLSRFSAYQQKNKEAISYEETKSLVKNFVNKNSVKLRNKVKLILP